MFCGYTVGAGSAGCVLANRLSASGKFKVLLIEAGDEETKYPVIPVPFLASLACTEPDAMWQDLTAPQDNCQAYKDQVVLRLQCSVNCSNSVCRT